MRRTFMAALLAVPLLVLPPPTLPATDLTALKGLAARLRTAQPWADTARASATTAPTAVTRYYLDTKRGIVAVGVEQVTPALTAAARETFGDSVVLHQADRVRQASRVNDFPAPHRGGAEILNSSLRATCTSGFAVNRPGAATPVAVLTAGHCARGLGDAFTNNGQRVGTVVQRELANGSLDAAQIGTSAEATIYTGGRTSTATARVAGTAEVSVGDTVCTSGAITAENCTGQVIGTNLCIVFQDSGNETCALDLFESPNGQRLTDRGDSGAPVYVYTGAAVNAVGMVVGGNSTGTQVAYHSMDTVLGFFGITLMTR